MEIKDNSFICADCMDILKEIPDKHFDLCLTDPPYGIKRDKGFEGFGGFGGFGEPIARKRYVGDWDSVKIKKPYFDYILRVSKNSIIFGGQFYTNCLPQKNHWIFWDKKQTMPTFGDGELAWTDFPRNSVKQFTVEWNGLIGKEKVRYHATQKPEKLMIDILMEYSKPGGLIIDPFCGSGTTVIACHKTGRRFVCIDKEPAYIEIAKKRYKALTDQTELLPLG